MRCLIYSRVSTDAQERDGTSLETQERACIEYATAAGWMIVRRVRDAASGYSLDRDGMGQIRRGLAQAEFDVVLSFAVDRLSRNQNHIGVLFDEANGYGVKLDFVTEKFEDTAVGRFILAARAFVAEVEREKIVERTQRGKAQRARDGKLPQATGKGIYGYRYIPTTGTREIDEAQARVVRRVFEAFAAGGSCHGIAVQLNTEHVPAFNGGRWYPLTLRRILLNETYTGRSVFRRTKAEKYRDGRSGKSKVRVVERAESEWIDVVGATPPIIPVDLFEQVGRILSDPQRRSQSKPSRSYPLRGRLMCGICGTKMVGQVLMKGRYSYYRCRNSYAGKDELSCEAKYIRSDALEQIVRGSLADLLASPERLIAEAERIQAVKTESSDIEPILADLRQVEAKQRRLVRLFTEGDMPYELLDAERRELAARRSHLESERIKLQGASNHEFDLEKFASYLPVTLAAIRSWATSAEGQDLELLLAAVNVKLVATSAEVRISGSVPLIGATQARDLVTIERTSA